MTGWRYYLSWLAVALLCYGAFRLVGFVAIETGWITDRDLWVLACYFAGWKVANEVVGR